jgi:two-component system chemotaxis response regulator CheY
VTQNQAISKTVLVVEDDQQIRDAVIEILETAGYQAVGAEDGQKALEYLTASQTLPCAILLDLMMPTMDGWQFRTHQQQDRKLKEIPIVVITADGNAQAKAKKMNAEGWVKKPIEIKSLLATVSRVCA